MMSKHGAIVTKLENIRKHPNADKLNIATIWNQQVIVGLNQNNGDVGLFFDSELQLSKEFVENNELKYFGNNRRVKAQNFRGVKSEGFWLPLSSLNFISDNVGKLKHGDKLDEFEGVKICNKFITKRTHQAKITKKVARKYPYFPKHIDTDQFDYKVGDIQEGSIIYVTAKIHGTSARLSHVLQPSLLSKWQIRINRFLPDSLVFRESLNYEFLVGSRNVVLDTVLSDSYYKDTFRFDVMERVKPFIQKDEIWFGEIVGYTTDGREIMPSQSVDVIKDNKYRKLVETEYGEKVSFTYGQPFSTNEFYVYRIARINRDQSLVDLSWSEVKKRCRDSGVLHVPDIDSFVYNGNKENLISRINELVDGENNLGWKDRVSQTSLEEGVVLRIEQPDGTRKFLKKKAYLFKLLEGIVKEDQDYVDMEESS